MLLTAEGKHCVMRAGKFICGETIENTLDAKFEDQPHILICASSASTGI